MGKAEKAAAEIIARQKRGFSNPTKPWSWHDRIYLQDAAQGKERETENGMRGGEISEFWIITILNMYGIQRERKPGNRNDHFCFHSVISFLMVFYCLLVDVLCVCIYTFFLFHKILSRTVIYNVINTSKSSNWFRG